METLKELFEYIQKEYPKNLKEIRVAKGLQRRLKDETIEEKLNQQLEKLLKFENINVKAKLGPYYNRSIIPWIQLFTDDNKKGTKGHYGGLSFEKEGTVSAWLGFGQTKMKKAEIIEKRNQYISEYAKIEMNLRHGFKYEQVYVDAVIISKTYTLANFDEEEFYGDMLYLMNLYKKHESKKKFGIINENTRDTEELERTEETEEIEQQESNGQILEKGINKLYKGYTQNGKIRKMWEEYLYKKDEENRLVLDENGKPVMINGVQYEIVTFHQNYRKEEFTYQLDPVSSQYVAGAFFRILKKAINYPKVNFYLIIEDFNQSNILEIFGDAINLLERKADGTSRYEIHSPIMAAYLYDKSNKKNSIYMPNNLSILAIENMKGKKIEQSMQSKFEIEWVESTNELLDNYYVKGFKNIKWGKLRKAINEQIDAKLSKINTEEDKIDSYFLQEEMLTDKKDTEELLEAREKVMNKLFIYLYENVCQYNPNILFNEKIRNVEELVQKVKGKKYIEIFNEEIQEKIKE